MNLDYFCTRHGEINAEGFWGSTLQYYLPLKLSVKGRVRVSNSSPNVSIIQQICSWQFSHHLPTVSLNFAGTKIRSQENYKITYFVRSTSFNFWRLSFVSGYVIVMQECTEHAFLFSCKSRTVKCRKLHMCWG